MGLASLTPYVAGTVLTAAALNNNENALLNQLNGNIETVNLANLAVTAAKLATGAVTGTKIAMGSDAQGDLLQRGASVYERIAAGTAGQALTSGGAAANNAWAGMTTQGDIEYRSATTRARLAAGTAGFFLKTLGAGANPAWAMPSEIVSGSYVGDATSPRNITIGFTDTAKTPKLVWISETPANGVICNSQFIFTGLAMGVAVSDGSGQNLGITAIAANQFTVQSQLNVNLTTFYFIAIG